MAKHQVNINYIEDDADDIYEIEDIDDESLVEMMENDPAVSSPIYQSQQLTDPIIKTPLSSHQLKDTQLEFNSQDNYIPIHDINFVPPNRLVILGSTDSGKTTTIRNIIVSLRNNYSIAAVWCFGRSADEETWIPRGFRSTTVDKEQLDKIRNIQNTKPFKDLHQIVILDDILGTNFHQDKWWSDFISTCRKQRITIIFSIQHLKAVPPVIRENCHKYIICNCDNGTAEALYALASCGTSKSQFKNLLSGKTFVKGRPVLFDRTPGAQELTKLSVPRLEASEMINN